MSRKLQIAELKRQMSAGAIIPFIGSGMSANLGLPPWSGLIEMMASAIGFERKLFLASGEFPALAEFYEIEKHGRSELVAWMKDNWDSPATSTLSSAIYDSITNCRFERIYTTNYDHLIERAFGERAKDIETIIDVSDFQKLNETHPKVIKFHGDFDRPESMVLTESDYYHRMSLDSELDLLLRSDVLRCGLLFLGYSLSDRNLRYILYKQNLIRNRLGLSPSTVKSYLFTHRVNHVEKALMARWNVEVIVSEEMEPRVALDRFLKELST